MSDGARKKALAVSLVVLVGYVAAGLAGLLPSGETEATVITTTSTTRTTVRPGSYADIYGRSVDASDAYADEPESERDPR